MLTKCRLLAVLLFASSVVIAKGQMSDSVRLLSEISLPKADTLLKQLVIQHNASKASSANKISTSSESLEMPFAKIFNGKVLVDIAISGNGQEIFESLVSLGLEHGTRYKNIISGYMPLDKAQNFHDHSGVVFINVSLMKTSAGSVDSQGDAVMNTDDARVNFGVDGSGVKVGTLSDSYNRLGGAFADVASNDLPAGVIVLKELPLMDPGTDEGRAMMQLIHDVAPGATQLFRSGAGGQADLAQGIIDLANVGTDVIVDDISYFDAPFFQDGIVGQAATEVIKQGHHYFSAAGNLNQHSYQAAFLDSGMVAPVVGGTMHDFGGGDTFQQFTVPNGSLLFLVFQWNQPYKTACNGAACLGATSNLDIYLRDKMSGTFIAASEIDNPTVGIPIEFIQYVNSGGAPQEVELFIVHRTGPIPSVIKYISPAGPSPDEYDTMSSSSFGQANAERVISVGSSAFFNTPAFGVDPAVSNNASSLGGTPIFFNSLDNNNAYPAAIIRQTPDIAGPDGGNNTFFGNDSVNDPDAFPNFFGTSAAAPHVAGLAALIIEESSSTLSPAQMESILEITALDMGDPGYDHKSGFGLVQADGPFGALCGDIDGDSFCIDQDRCPSDPNKTSPGECGCGQVEGECDDDEPIVVENTIVEEAGLAFYPPPFGYGGWPLGDADSDGDGVLDSVDNCPTVANPSQADSDNNAIGDACEAKAPLKIEAQVTRAETQASAEEAPDEDVEDSPVGPQSLTCTSSGGSSLTMLFIILLLLQRKIKI